MHGRDGRRRQDDVRQDGGRPERRAGPGADVRQQLVDQRSVLLRDHLHLPAGDQQDRVPHPGALRDARHHHAHGGALDHHRLPQAGRSEQRHRLCRSAFLHRRCRNGAALPEGRLHEGRDQRAVEVPPLSCPIGTTYGGTPDYFVTSAPSGAIRRPPWSPRARRRIPPFRPTSSRPAARTAPTRRCCPAPSATPTWTASTR